MSPDTSVIWYLGLVLRREILPGAGPWADLLAAGVFFADLEVVLRGFDLGLRRRLEGVYALMRVESEYGDEGAVMIVSQITALEGGVVELEVEEEEEEGDVEGR